MFEEAKYREEKANATVSIFTLVTCNKTLISTKITIELIRLKIAESSIGVA